jgi:hypothetical protein
MMKKGIKQIKTAKSAGKRTREKRGKNPRKRKTLKDREIDEQKKKK